MSAHQQGTLRPDVSDKDHSIGPADAAVTLVEYGDYQCPHCLRAHPVINSVRRTLGDKLRFVFRNFPLTQIHPHALHAAEAAESVAASTGESAYWEMHDAIFEHQRDSADALDDDHLIAYAAGCGADPAQVRQDLDSNKFEEKVRADFMTGVRSGVNGTPTFFVNGVRFEGDWTKPKFFAAALQEGAALVGASRTQR
jgi:protein-disulfide isomerase